MKHWQSTEVKDYELAKTLNEWEQMGLVIFTIIRMSGGITNYLRIVAYKVKP